MFRKVLYETIGNERMKTEEMLQKFETWSKKAEIASEAAFCAGFESALKWVEDIIATRTIEQKERYYRELKKY